MPAGIGPDHAIKAVNLHASLLPRWRGAAPVTRAIEAGDPQTGVTLMKMEAGLDTGPFIMTLRPPRYTLVPNTTLTERLASLGTELLLKDLKTPDALTFTPQPEDGANYAEKVLFSMACAW